MARASKPVDLQTAHLTKEEYQQRKQAEEKLKGNDDLVYKPPKHLSKEEKKVYRFIVEELRVSQIARHFKEKGIYSMIVWVMEQNKSGVGFYRRMGGKKYIRRTSTFGETVVDDVAYGWNDVSGLCNEGLNKVN